MSDEVTVSLRESALAYAGRGWHVFPCHTPQPSGCSCRRQCTDIGKHPRTRHGVHDATTDAQRIRRWWSQWPYANIGIATGALSGIVVLDEDSYKGGDDTLRTLERTYSVLPETIYQLTGGGGLQYLFLHPGPPVGNSAERLGQGIDIRGDGGYIIAPPSLHQSGKRYAWEVSHDPDDTPLAPLPAWLLALITTRPTQTPSASAIIPEGRRNETLFRLGASMRARGFILEAINAALQAINSVQCSPPLTEDAVERIAASCGAYPLGASRRAHEAATAPTGTPPVAFDPTALTDAHAMQATAYPPTHWLIPGLIADGLTILGGSPKSGKSYLAYGLALAVCRPALWCQEWHAEEGTVTFVSLEDDEADSAERVRQLAPGVRLAPGRLHFLHGAERVPSFDEGFLAWVEALLKAQQPRLLVIDPISYLYVLKRSVGQFEETKDMLFPLRWLGKQYRCAIVCVDHRRKRSRDDVSIFDTLHGSVAKLAVADALLMVERDESEITVAALVRKGKDQTLHLTLTFDQDTATLAYSGDSGMKTTSYGTLRQDVYTVLMKHPAPLGLEDIITLLGIADSRATREAVRQTLLRGYHAKEIERTSRNQYLLAQREN